MSEEKREGWGWPLNARKAHYFIGSVSLCGGWMFGGDLEEGKDQTPSSIDDCRDCTRRLAKRRG